MINVLYVAPVTEDSHAVNGGYSEVANSFNKVFKHLKESEFVDTYTVINPTEQKTPIQLASSYDIGIILTHPDSFNHAGFKESIMSLRKLCKKFYLHIFWEVSEFPLTWKWMFTDNMFDGFIASSDYVVDLLKRDVERSHSVQKVFKIYPSLYEEDFPNARINIEEKKNESKFTVLYMGQYTKRKGMEDAVTSFAHALGDKEDCQLVLKYHRLSKLEFPEEEMIKRTVSMNCKEFKAQIFEVTDNLNRQQIIELYKSSSVVLHPSRGEGFGFVIVESCIVGIPIIYADNSSCREVSCNNRQYIVPCYQDTPIGMTQYNYPSDGTYGVPYMCSMIDYLKQAYELWKESKEKYYNVGSEDFIFNKFSEKVVTEQIMKLM